MKIPDKSASAEKSGDRSGEKGGDKSASGVTDLDSGISLASLGDQSTESEFYSPVPPGYVKGRHKYVVVFGTVMSGLGKGIFSSSLAKMLKDKGLTVAPIKMEG